jgi:hypothetical protein
MDEDFETRTLTDERNGPSSRPTTPRLQAPVAVAPADPAAGAHAIDKRTFLINLRYRVLNVRKTPFSKPVETELFSNYTRDQDKAIKKNEKVRYGDYFAITADISTTVTLRKTIWDKCNALVRRRVGPETAMRIPVSDPVFSTLSCYIMWDHVDKPDGFMIDLLESGEDLAAQFNLMAQRGSRDVIRVFLAISLPEQIETEKAADSKSTKSK